MAILQGVYDFEFFVSSISSAKALSLPFIISVFLIGYDYNYCGILLQSISSFTYIHYLKQEKKLTNSQLIMNLKKEVSWVASSYEGPYWLSAHRLRIETRRYVLK